MAATLAGRIDQGSRRLQEAARTREPRSYRPRDLLLDFWWISRVLKRFDESWASADEDQKERFGRIAERVVYEVAPLFEVVADDGVTRLGPWQVRTRLGLHAPLSLPLYEYLRLHLELARRVQHAIEADNGVLQREVARRIEHVVAGKARGTVVQSSEARDFFRSL